MSFSRFFKFFLFVYFFISNQASDEFLLLSFFSSFLFEENYNNHEKYHNYNFL